MPPVDPKVVASYLDVSRIEEMELEAAGCLICDGRDISSPGQGLGWRASAAIHHLPRVHAHLLSGLRATTPIPMFTVTNARTR